MIQNKLIQFIKNTEIANTLKCQKLEARKRLMFSAREIYLRKAEMMFTKKIIL